MESTAKPNGPLANGILSLIGFALIIVGLIYGRAFLVPIVTAMLILTLLRAMSSRLEAIGLPNLLATFGAILVFIAVFFGIGLILSGQADAVGQAWPQYVSRFEVIATSMSAWAGPEVSERLRSALTELNLRNQVPALIGTAGGLVGYVVLTVLYVGFLLAGRGALSGRIEFIVENHEQAARTRRILNDISQGVRQYLWIKTIMSLLTALVSYIVLKFLQIDFAEIWTLLIFLLNFIPSIGSVLGVIFPALLALVQFDTTWQFMVIAVALSAVQFFIGNVIEPAIMGRTLNLSPFVVIVSLSFWSMIWGVVGAFLSVPLTAAFVIALSHIPTYRWIAILLADDINPNRSSSEAPQIQETS